MFFNPQILREILSVLKKRKGATLSEISEAIPEEFSSYTDYNPKYLALETLGILIRWGLVEAFKGKELIDIKEVTEKST